MSVERLPEPNPMTGCPLNHDTIEAKYLIGDDGWSLGRCAFCNLPVEPKLASKDDPHVVGPAWGVGRGAIGPRLQARLRGLIGWLQYQGIEP